MNIPYKSYIIQLSPVSEDYNFGVLGVVSLTENDAAPLYQTTRMNSFPGGRGAHGGTRTSRQTTQLAVKKCKEWIDKRVELYSAIAQVVKEETTCRG